MKYYLYLITQLKNNNNVIIIVGLDWLRITVFNPIPKKNGSNSLEFVRTY